MRPNKLFLNQNTNNINNNHSHGSNNTFNAFSNNSNIQNINGLGGMPNNSQYQNVNVMHNQGNVIGMRNPSKFHVHSTANMMNFNDLNGFSNGYNQYGDEQLLEGLSEEDKLF